MSLINSAFKRTKNEKRPALITYTVEIISCDENGNIDLQNLKEKAELHSENLSCIMLTYPSTHGIFESEIREACEIVHRHVGKFI